MTEFASPALSFIICMLGSILALYARSKIKATTAADHQPPNP